ncbi:MAG: BamA/TamA family outer membrane protein [Luteitalea sp.]|nr:BamA/TamA family outer membrane protein [Luteitalea sp.]
MRTLEAPKVRQVSVAGRGPAGARPARTLALMLILLGLPVFGASAQETEMPEGALIKSVDVSGSDLNLLSPKLRDDINALVGERLHRERLDALAMRIEAENPDVVATVRTLVQPDGQVRVTFFLERISDARDLMLNINARYTVESVEISGISERKVSRQLRDDLQSLVGTRLDSDEAKRLEKWLAAELPDYRVTRHIARGSQPGRIRVVFEVGQREEPWIPFRPSRSKLVYHADQKWSGVLDISNGGRRHRATVGFVFSNGDDLIEDYSGFRVRLESRELVTERLGASLEVSRLRQTWHPDTLAALAADPRIPEAYRERLTVEPTVTFAFSPHVRITAGASVSELESLSRSPESQKANAVVASIAYDQRWKQRRVDSQNLAASYEWRSATSELDSDLVYTRHVGQVDYQYERGKSAVIAGLAVGRITGRAPLFERFSLGDSSTLRGWNKFDIAPTGGDRMFHQSLEYRYRHIAWFLDTGSVWDPDAEMKVRFSTGFGYHTDNTFLTVGFPLNASEVTATFMMGVRF